MTSRPRRSSTTAPAAPREAAVTMDERLDRAEALAAAALRAEATGLDAADVGALPGFAEGLDAADAAWAALGALERGQLAVARQALETLLAAQRADGAMPARLAPRRGLGSGLGDQVRRLLGKPLPRRALAHAVFADEVAPTATATAMTAWAAGEYALRAGDAAFVERHAAALDAAVRWIDARMAPGLPCVGAEAAYHQAQMALGHLAIAQGDAVTGARRWAAAAAAKGRIQETERAPGARVADVLLAVYVGACDRAVALDAVSRATASAQAPVVAGLAALAATRAGELARAQAALLVAAEAAIAADGFGCAAGAGRYVRALGELRQALATAAPEAPAPRRWQLSEDEARILSVC